MIDYSGCKYMHILLFTLTDQHVRKMAYFHGFPSSSLGFTCPARQMKRVSMKEMGVSLLSGYQCGTQDRAVDPILIKEITSLLNAELEHTLSHHCI